MKKLLLTPFLLASLFSFGGELKAHPTRMDSTSKRTPVAAVNRWYLLSYATREEKNIYVYPNSKTLIKHDHSYTTIGTWGFGESVPVPPPSIAFKSQQECELQASRINSFYSERLPKDYEHTHTVIPQSGFSDAVNITHTHRFPNAVRFKFKHECIKGTVDY